MACLNAVEAVQRRVVRARYWRLVKRHAVSVSPAEGSVLQYRSRLRGYEAKKQLLWGHEAF